MDTKTVAIPHTINMSDNSIVSSNESDVFYLFALYLNKVYDFKSLTNYIDNTKEFQTKLVVLLNKYYKTLDFEKYDESNRILFQLLEILSVYQLSIMEYTNSHFEKKFNSYFKEIKSNTQNLDPCNSNNKIISDFQLEWTIRMYKLDMYYDKIVEQNDASFNSTKLYLENSSSSTNFFTRAIKYLSSSKVKNSNQQGTIMVI